MGVLFEWSRWLARCGDVHGGIVALCLGELASRAAARLGLPVPFAGPGPEGLALLVSVACLAAGAAVFLYLRNRVSPDAHDEGAADGPAVDGLEAWERERLSEAGLTARELDVLAASVDGCDSAEAARRLEVSPSTVRTYKGRICKKLGLGSFDQVLGSCSARTGLFEPSDGTGTGHVPQPGPETGGEAGKRSTASALLHLAGCLSLFALLLMPFGMLPLLWNSVWTMAYACAAGILLSFIPAFLRRMGLHRPGPVGRTIPSVAFFACAAACLAVRLHIGAGATGFGLPQRLMLFATVTGLVCFGLLTLRSCAGTRLETGRFGAACACAAGMVVVASLGTAFWLGSTVFSLLGFAVGTVLGKRGKGQDEGRAEYGSDARSAVAASWFVIAFVWEECWRGVTYASLQGVGLPFLVILILLDALVLLGRKDGGRASCSVILVCTTLLCLMRGIVFGLLVGTVLLEVQVLRMPSPAPRGRAKNREDAPPALLAAAVGCCVAVSVVNAWGSHVLLRAGSTTPTGLDWLVPCCFACRRSVEGRARRLGFRI